MLTNDEMAEYRLLSLANEKRKFGIGLTASLGDLQDAFERGIDNEWFTLVDVSPVESARGQICKVFRLTVAGIARRRILTAKVEED